MSEIEMILERDEFVVTFDPSHADKDSLISVIEKVGYTAYVATDSARTEASAGAEAGAESEEDADEASPYNAPIFAEALARAKRDNKPVVVDFYADWCPPCVKMLKSTIPDPKVAALLERCVFLKIDTDEHPKLAKRFDVVGLPDIRFYKPDGTETKRLLDFQDAESFAAELEALLASIEPSE